MKTAIKFLLIVTAAFLLTSWLILLFCDAAERESEWRAERLARYYETAENWED